MEPGFELTLFNFSSTIHWLSSWAKLDIENNTVTTWVWSLPSQNLNFTGEGREVMMQLQCMVISSVERRIQTHDIRKILFGVLFISFFFFFKSLSPSPLPTHTPNPMVIFLAIETRALKQFLYFIHAWDFFYFLFFRMVRAHSLLGFVPWMSHYLQSVLGSFLGARHGLREGGRQGKPAGSFRPEVWCLIQNSIFIAFCIWDWYN